RKIEGVAINPPEITLSEDYPNVPKEIRFVKQFVEFDVALTVSESNEKSGGAGVNVVGVRLGGDVRGTTEHSTTHRIKFSIPVEIR
ncbi:MAG: trypco2 family protein, partial [Phycisphaerae bacterium]